MTPARIGGANVFLVPDNGEPIGTEQDALDLIGEIYGQEIDLIVIPVARLHPDFLRLGTRMAGGFLQKMRNYGQRVAVVGEISAAVAASKALHDFVYESNRTGHVLFASDLDDLVRRLGTITKA